MEREPKTLLARTLSFLVSPPASRARADALVRGAVGGVFLVSGILKFVFDNQGPGRFAKLGLPAALDLAYFVGGIEVACGGLLIVGLLTRLAAVPLVIDMLFAIATTKLPLLFGAGPEPVSALPKIGFWAFAYQARLDLTMLVSCIYLVIVGPGLWSLDELVSRRQTRSGRHGLAVIGSR